jgi:hypothetical protein
MSVKVELGFTPEGASAPFFTLDDSVKGVLDSAIYVLGGEVLADVTEYVRGFRIGRGKSRELDRFTAGGVSVQFNNDTRVFDPVYQLSPFYGQIQPKRRIRVWVDDIVQFDGTIWDWDIQYEAGGYSVAIANAFDATQLLANINLIDYAPSQELSGARINGVLDEIGWSATKRNIDVGSANMVGDAVTSATNAFEYLQTVAQSEPGDLFISKEGDVKFVDRYTEVTGETVAFSDAGSEITYTGISALIGSELLFNNITVTSSAGTATATSTNSVEIYGEIDYNLATFVATQPELDTLADFLLNRYSEPRYRIEAISINLENLTAPDRAKVLGLDLGDVISVTFTPSGIPPAIVEFTKVIRIDQSIEPQNQIVTLGLEALTGVVMVLDNAEFGKLDSGYFLSGPYNAWTLNDAIYGRLSAGMAVS